MAEKLVRIATPEEVQRFADYAPAQAERVLREEGFDLGELTLDHFLLHAPSPEGYFTVYSSPAEKASGVYHPDYLDALDEFEELARKYLSEKPGFVLTSPDLYEDVQGHLLFSALTDSLGFKVERVLTLEDLEKAG